MERAQPANSSLFATLSFVVSIAVALLIVINFEAGSDEPGKVWLLLLSLTLLGYLTWEICRVIRKDRRMGFVQPPVIASIVLFLNSYFFPTVPILIGLTNPIVDRYLHGDDDIYWLNMATLAVLLAVFAMCAGRFLTRRAYGMGRGQRKARR